MVIINTCDDVKNLVYAVETLLTNTREDYVKSDTKDLLILTATKILNKLEKAM